MVQTVYIYNQSDIETIQPMTTDQTFSKERTMRQEPKADVSSDVRNAVFFASWMDAHPTLSNIIIGIMAVLAFYVVLTYNFTTH